MKTHLISKIVIQKEIAFVLKTFILLFFNTLFNKYFGAEYFLLNPEISSDLLNQLFKKSGLKLYLKLSSYFCHMPIIYVLLFSIKERKH